jgi:hypothetical protein
VVGTLGLVVGDGVVRGVQVQLPVVLLSFGGRAKGRIGFGDEDEALGGVGVGGVAVWVVGFGESVEGPGEVGD